jgi:hypothetical protein
MEETTITSLEQLRASVSGFIGAVKIMGLNELRQARKLDRIRLPGSMPDNLIRFKTNYRLSDSILRRPGVCKKKDLPSYYMDMEINADQAVIKSFTAIPGVTEDRARTLYFSGFTTIDGLKSASVAKLFGVPGMPLAAKRSPTTSMWARQD